MATVATKQQITYQGGPLRPDEPLDVVQREYAAAREKAWDALRRYKFSNFGYWASRTVFLGQLIGQLGGERPANPFRDLVHFARGMPAGSPLPRDARTAGCGRDTGPRREVPREEARQTAGASAGGDQLQHGRASVSARGSGRSGERQPSASAPGPGPGASSPASPGPGALATGEKGGQIGRTCASGGLREEGVGGLVGR